MSAPSAHASTPAKDEAEQAIARLNDVMDRLSATVEEETARLRTGRLHAALELSQIKGELAHLYSVETARVRAASAQITRTLPEAVEALRQRHVAFRAVLQTNLTVLATAHAVSEGIIRGVSGDLARRRAPSTYGATGRANVPGTKASQPLALSRTL